MWNARCEIPEIADADVIDEVVPLSVDGGDAGAAVKHVGPFGSLVPMQFANAAGIQTHVHAGNVLGNTEFPHGDLAVQPPVSCRTWESEKEKRRLGSVP